MTNATVNPSTNDLYWAAGFIDGEGCFYWRPAGKQGNFSVSACQNEKWPLERLQSFFGGSIGSSKPGHYSWKITQARARGVMMTLYSLLGPRRQAKIREILSKPWWDCHNNKTITIRVNKDINKEDITKSI